MDTLDGINGLLDNIGDFLNSLRPVALFPVITVILLIVFYLYYIKAQGPLPGTTQWVDRELAKPRLPFILKRYPMSKDDIIPLLVITAVFTFLALFQLGDTEAPQSFYQFNTENKTVVIELDDPVEIGSIMYYTGMWTGHYKLELSADRFFWYEQIPEKDDDSKNSTEYAMNQPYAHLFKWQTAKLNDGNPPVKYIRISTQYSPLELGELALFNINGELIGTDRISNPDAPELFDEQELVPQRQTYMNSMYFDEIFHGRTAMEHLRDIKPYERTHPPLGKIIIAVSIHFLGMTPFGWRLPGALLGVVMLIILYILIKNLFGKTRVAVCGTLLLGFDFMRFVQTRIATIDTYGVLFILLACFFMYRYITTDPDAPFRKGLVPLALSGISFGLGCASKWIVAYAGIGLAAVYIVRLVHLSKYYKEKKLPEFGVYLSKTLAYSVLFFVAVPIVIYCLSYIPYGLAEGMKLGDGMLLDKRFHDIIWENQIFMLTYHGKDVIGSTHPYSSQWWQWILDARPILYFNTYNDGLRSSFSAFGNPVVWWGGFLAMIAMVYRAIRYRDGKAMFILIGFLSQFLPWLPIARIVFIYHYFPSTLFIVLALAHVFDTLLDSGRRWRKPAVYGYTAYTGAVFALFYPGLTGIAVPFSYFNNFLRWIPGAWPY